MDIQRLSAYLPLDRRHALAAAGALPDRAAGAALFADIAGGDALTRLIGDALDALSEQ